MTDTSTRKPSGPTATLTTDTLLTIRQIADLTGQGELDRDRWQRPPGFAGVQPLPV